MRVLMLIPHPDSAGPMRRLAELLVDGLRSVGCEVATEPWGGRAGRDSLLAKALDRLGEVVHVRRGAARARPDALLVQTSHEWPSLVRDFVLAGAVRGRARKIVLQFHGGHADRLVGSEHRLFKHATALLLKLTDGVLVLSSQQQRDLRTFFPSGRFYVVANPFEAADAERARASANGRGHGSPVLLFASRLLAQKGIFDLIDAFALLDPASGCRLVVAGDGRADEVRRYVAARGVADRVTLAGHLTRERLFQLYHDVDVFVLPASPPEGFPTAITEAMGAGLPIVTSEVGGIPDHLREGVNALFVPPRDPEALAEALERMLSDAELRERMSRANLEKVREFAPKRVAQQYVLALEDILTAD